MAGLAGERSGLWREFARVVGVLRPSYVLVENVSALLARGMGAVLGELVSHGYDCEWACIPAASVGAPHIRDRVFIVGYSHCLGLEVGSCFGGNAQEELASIARANRSPGGQWHKDPAEDPESGMGRMAHGIPDRVDRIRVLGNAVVPQVAQFIGERITSIHQQRLQT
jgi:DNA (cytosine-5)-methyltransferase 1